MSGAKSLSNPFSTGGGGGLFEAHVQTSFVALMLTGGFAPALPCWPIVQIKLQGKVDGYETDDLIIEVERPGSKERRKLLGQVKHSIAITKSDSKFCEVIQAAWGDFTNPKVFSVGKDLIALITGPLSATDSGSVAWLSNHARATGSDSERFFRDVSTAKFSSDTKRQKLDVFEHQLRIANGGTDVDRKKFHSFLKHFYYLGYDLGEEEGVILSLINSHISQYERKSPRMVWSRLLEFTQTTNHHAGVITASSLPEEIAEIFSEPVATQIPESFKSPPSHLAATTRTTADWLLKPEATDLALACLLGSWNDKNESDVKIITGILGADYDEWIRKAQNILHFPGEPLSVKNGRWTVNDRA